MHADYDTRIFKYSQSKEIFVVEIAVRIGIRCSPLHPRKMVPDIRV